MTNQAMILVVEDEVIVALDLQIRLERMGYRVPATALTGEEALALADQLRPDLIFMDIGLQGDLDGIEAALKIKERFGFPIAFLTAYSDAVTKELAQVALPVGFLTKPFADEEILNVIQIGLNVRK
jgi:CheY-like chemotaxis protein